jgi:hypothetical protein
MEAIEPDEPIGREERQTRGELQRLWAYSQQDDASEGQFIALALGILERVKTREAARVQSSIILGGKAVERRGA